MTAANKMTPTPWTSEETDRLKALLLDDKTYAECAKELNRTKCSCIGRANRMGFRDLPKPEKVNVTHITQDEDYTHNPKKFTRPHEISIGYGMPIKLLVELGPNECRFALTPPDSEGKKYTQWFCAAPTNSVYCENHRKICYRPKQ